MGSFYPSRCTGVLSPFPGSGSDGRAGKGLIPSCRHRAGWGCWLCPRGWGVPGQHNMAAPHIHSHPDAESHTG